MNTLFEILLKAFWVGTAALGFSILFNTPARTLAAIWIGGFISGLVKFSTLFFIDPTAFVQATFLASLSVGILSIPAAHWRHVPPAVLAIPPVIPLMPGVFAYKTMMGLAALTRSNQDYTSMLAETFHFGTLTVFIVMAIALGVSIPMHVLRAKSVKNLRFGRK